MAAKLSVWINLIGRPRGPGFRRMELSLHWVRSRLQIIRIPRCEWQLCRRKPGVCFWGALGWKWLKYIDVVMSPRRIFASCRVASKLEISLWLFESFLDQFGHLDSFSMLQSSSDKQSTSWIPPTCSGTQNEGTRLCKQVCNAYERKSPPLKLTL